MASYDVIIIGSGPGGYVCAIRCAQLGLKVACVEGRDTLGGTCLNVGCIPSKALLHASHMLHEAEHNFAEMGLKGKSPSVDWRQMLTYKQSTVDTNTKGIEFLFKKNKIDWLKGWGSIPEAGKVKVGDEVHEAKNIIIATGSEAASLPGVEVDEKVVVTSTGALELGKVPKSMVVIGAGVIGLELGSVYARLGSEVTVVEYLDAITPGMDPEVQKTFQRMLTKQGLKFIMGAAVQKTEATKTKAKVHYKLRKDDSEHVLDADVVLVATGRKPYVDGLGLEGLGIEMTKRGQIKVAKDWQTSVPGVYAIGDVIEGPMLAHKAEDEGMAAAEQVAGKHGHVNYGVIPGVIYTHPEVASVGETEATLKEAGRAYKVGKFSFMGNARAKAVFAGDGFVKILADKETDRILGCHIIGPGAGDLIHEVCVAMEFGASAEDLAMTCHAHPTFSEAVREAALACGDGPIHM
ncbi:dihydrolipoyl dehydrogenase [Sulfitobacter pseudonitzschiae]|uniref:Dihydrolipoyl dehydrogenase n=1 Tax=Pseudosulfitobacter pseudonitzschiae TaxID=1402135 RepID=A0A9Q2NMV8_9RHOB|nr:dihydrolipoyl dehydrogenase [Pseudosulfitobacter pseudonitzschiae]MBM2291699.1 dihydrolipoyl dehydrogenase [Pseudosulfitobacter pseudonitzschiae]MBM2296617.1 dihydrolipoyl dehydrogenase [Pseudosulfitobacter pseudonitzschiae]MBM2301530.1 dihydrolipoyl dehydrogenase [Pseudosulfitobacter pseudonitzschiae]MBM2311314.1 dihydrolipoyl dehydrogenase [Pseudosulfitobacter pseudonitzschiae]MBM2316227.1 dihydrolipoyl dehydrogenase [Pseudosulfitobacter pseudonitzschiae]